MTTNQSEYLFSSESVTEGHPDKVCDQISDAILDELLIKEKKLQDSGYCDENGPANLKNVRCACETLVTTGLIMLAGEIRTQSYVDVSKVAREVVRDIGYNHIEDGFDCESCAVLNEIHGQSPDIAMGVDNSAEFKNSSTEEDFDKIGAGDQGIIFGYACNETDTLMPLPIHLAHRLSQRLAQVRKDGTVPFLRPDGKTQVTLRYVDDKPKSIDTLVVSTQHTADVTLETVQKQVLARVVEPTLDSLGFTFNDDIKLFINPTGRFVVGGPAGDTGVTGRKIIVDTYGGAGHHGGGAFSGKDATKVDRSASYAARWVAKNVVAAGLADRCEVQIAYAIGVANPVSVAIDTFGTSKVPEANIKEAIDRTFDLRPAAIQSHLDLWRPIYRLTSNYGHFGRELDEFTWEKTDKADELAKLV